MSDSFLTLLGAILIAGVIVLVMWPGKDFGHVGNGHGS